MCRFERGVDEITKAITSHGILADFWARGIVKLEERLEPRGGADDEAIKTIKAKQRNIVYENKAIAQLGTFYSEVKRDWSDIKLDRNIGHVQY